MDIVVDKFVNNPFFDHTFKFEKEHGFVFAAKFAQYLYHAVRNESNLTKEVNIKLRSTCISYTCNYRSHRVRLQVMIEIKKKPIQLLLSAETTQFLQSKTGKMFLGLILGDGTLSKCRFEHSQRSLYWEYSKHINQQFQKEFSNLLTPKILNQLFYIKSRQNPESLTTYNSQTFYTKRHSIFEELSTLFYPNGKKIMPMEMLRNTIT